MIQAQEIRTVAVIGSGVMGSGIAQTFAQAGCAVRLHARRDATLQAALDRIAKNQAAMVQAGLLDGAVAQDARARIHATTDLAEAVRECQFVSESVPEDLAQKQAVFAALDRQAPPEAVLSTDTSGLSVSAIAAATTRPEVVVGFHWMNPAHLMPPVEVIRGERTADAAMDLACALARRIGRFPIRVEKDVPGFLQTDAAIAARDARLFALLKLVGTPASPEPERPGQQSAERPVFAQAAQKGRDARRRHPSVSDGYPGRGTHRRWVKAYWGTPQRVPEQAGYPAAGWVPADGPFSAAW